MTHMTRRRLGSMSDNSAPSSDASEISDSVTHDWNIESTHQVKDLFLVNQDNDQSDSDDTTIDTGIINEQERAQIESFFSGLGTEVRNFLDFLLFNIIRKCYRKGIKCYVKVKCL